MSCTTTTMQNVLRRPQPRKLSADAQLHGLVAGKLAKRWSPAQISRWLRRRYQR